MGTSDLYLKANEISQKENPSEWRLGGRRQNWREETVKYLTSKEMSTGWVSPSIQFSFG